MYDEVLSGYQPAQPFDPAASSRELHHTQSLGKQQISPQKCKQQCAYFQNILIM